MEVSGISVTFRNKSCTLHMEIYPNFGEICGPRIALILILDETNPLRDDLRDIPGSPMATATVNVPELTLGRGQVLIKDYSENHGMLRALIDAGVLSPVEELTHPLPYNHVTIYRCTLMPVIDLDHFDRMVDEMRASMRQMTDRDLVEDIGL